jgi:hypothetical protein
MYNYNRLKCLKQPNIADKRHRSTTISAHVTILLMDETREQQIAK